MKRLITFTLLLALLLAGCTTAAPAPTATGGDFPLTLTNPLGDEFVLEQEPQKVITLAPNVTETLYALNAGEKIVGRTDWDVYPEEVLDVPSVGDMMEPSLEAIVAAEPDLVFASNFMSHEMVQKIIDAGIPVVTIIDQETVEGTFSTIEQVGKIVNQADRASEVIAEMKSTLEEVAERLMGTEKVTVYYAVGFGEGGDYTATGETFIHDILTLAGGENVAGDVTGWSYNLETLLQKDPEVVIVSNEWDSLARFLSTSGYNDLTAAKNGKVYEIDTDIMEVQGPRTALAVFEIARLLHPEKFE